MRLAAYQHYLQGRVCNGPSIRWPVAAFLCPVGLKHSPQVTGHRSGLWLWAMCLQGKSSDDRPYGYCHNNWIHGYCYFCGRRIIIPVIALTLPVTCVLDQLFSAVVSWFEQNWFPLNKTMEFDHADPGRRDLALSIGGNLYSLDNSMSFTWRVVAKT